MIISERLKELRLRAGLTQQEVAERLSVSVQAVSNWENGKNNPATDKLMSLLELYDQRGANSSKMSQGGGDSPSVVLLDVISEALSSSGSEQNRDDDFVRVPIDDNGDPVQSSEIPPGSIAEIDTKAGMGPGHEVRLAHVKRGEDHFVVDAHKPEYWSVPRDFVREELRAPISQIIIVPTSGDSMTPTIETNERVFVDTGHVRPSPDGIYCIRDDFGGLVVKRLQVDGDDVIIISDNPKHPSRRRRLDEIHVVGKVIAGIKRY